MTSGAIDTEIGARLSPTLVALEQLRSLLEGNKEVSIPGVVVAGAQSAGKSSVLEALAGMKLPRGQNITTRVPLILSLQCIAGAPTHAIISDDPGMADSMSFNVADVGPAIEEFTKKLAGVGSGVRETPIYLRVIRDSGPTLTLIDLPGITHNSADETQDIHSETVGLVTRYIENENMVILVVIPAMDDFANAEAVALAKKYDPEGRRTLGVVTKFIPEFTKLAKRRIKELDADLRQMPETFTNDSQRSEAFRNVVSQVRDQLKDLLTIGNDEKITADEVLNVVPQVTTVYRAYSTDALQAMVPDFFSDEYYERARDALKRVDGMALSNLLSGRAFNILFREVFSEVLEPSSRHMVAIVKEYMERVLKTLFHKACEYYPGLLSEINGALVEEFMESKEKNTLKAVANVVNAELDWVFTQDRGYVKLIEDVREKVDQVRAEELCSKATKEADTKKSRFTAPQADAGVDHVPSEFIQKMVSSKSGKDEGTRELQVTIHSYTDVVCRRLSDVVPMQTHHFLVSSICSELVPWMLKKVSASDLASWLAEDIKTQRRRKDTSRKLAQFKQGMKLLEGARSTL
eukprot:jgi/Undpi1/7680/HiC_scaffold_23.g10153.m1